MYFDQGWSEMKEKPPSDNSPVRFASEVILNFNDQEKIFASVPPPPPRPDIGTEDKGKSIGIELNLVGEGRE